MRKHMLLTAGPVLVVGLLALSTTAEAMLISCRKGREQCTHHCFFTDLGTLSCRDKCERRYKYCMTQLGSHCKTPSGECVNVVPIKRPGNTIQLRPPVGSSILDGGPVISSQSPAATGVPLGAPSRGGAGPLH
jgi:hypothetical protein